MDRASNTDPQVDGDLAAAGRLLGDEIRAWIRDQEAQGRQFPDLLSALIEALAALGSENT